MTKGQDALKHWKETNTEKGVTHLPLFVVELVEKELKALETLKKNIKVEIDYGNNRDISVALVFYIDGKKTIYVVDEATREINPEHFNELENLKEVLE